jgi:hypothetical protein
VLVVRTDLGMTKGTTPHPPFPTSHSTMRQTTQTNPRLSSRQNRSTMLPRHARMLQIPAPHRATLPAVPRGPNPAAVGAPRAGQDRRAGQERGRASDLARQGAESRGDGRGDF